MVIEPMLVMSVGMPFLSVLMSIVVPEDRAIFRSFESRVVTVRDGAGFNPAATLANLEELLDVNKKTMLATQAALDDECIGVVPKRERLDSTRKPSSQRSAIRRS
jgi:hypothetical protein